MGNKYALKGSDSRDDFKFWHKTAPMPKRFYALDLDFIFVEKSPPRIVALLDYKKQNDGISFSECIAYNDFMQHYPVYIVKGDPPFEEFDIYRYEGGDFRPDPPDVRLTKIAHLKGQQEFIQWEWRVRNGEIA